ncbi:MAG: MerR family DNA-binding transcriptional regulator [Gammaproteobacteria bacterium]|nr:MerR family DNA-binding transcriptional regulator [Gammaproteobacteria bacterium]MBQ0839931.1 MerR family DNA-binding transcriptional regulator [Gammaproteobacteria bacterium]
MLKEKTTYSISELAQEFDVTTRTIRHYEDMQLLLPARQGQKRIYSLADRTKLKLIVRGKRIGLSLQESGELLNMYEPGQSNVDQLERTLEYIGTSRQKLSQQLRDISTMLDDLDEAEAGCKVELKALHDIADQHSH